MTPLTAHAPIQHMLFLLNAHLEQKLNFVSKLKLLVIFTVNAWILEKIERDRFKFLSNKRLKLKELKQQGKGVHLYAKFNINCLI